MLRPFFAFLTLLTLFFAAGRPVSSAVAQTTGGRALVEAALVAESSGVVPGKPFTAALHLKIKPGWHTYWINPGDSGLPVELQWKLPEGWKAGAIQWPVPTKTVEQGDMITYGYTDELLLMAELTPPADLPPGKVTLAAHASWLVCDKSCVPGGADLELTLPVGGEPQPAEGGLFAKFRSRLPKTGEPPFALRWEFHDTEVHLKVDGAAPPAGLDFFPLSTTPGGHTEVLSPGLLRIPLPPSPPASGIEGLLVHTQPGTGETEGWMVHSPAAPGGAASTAAVAPGKDAGETLTLSRALGLGFLGGFILNLMPCVLPVIALKIFGFLGQAGESRRRVFRVGMAFVAGIFAWFLGLAGLVTLARAAGHEVNWAFQFQDPRFVFGMAALVFVFALNLLGVFELWLPGTGRLVSLSEKEGYGGAFLHGVFATLLATPCTAPFLGPALAFAFAQSAPVTFAMFTSIAAGMSAPYVILTARPGWMRFLPKPGLWMVRLKQIMGFLLLGTVVWLLEVMASQSGAEGAVGMVWKLTGLGAACWIFGIWVTPGARRLQQWVALLGMAAVIALGFFLAKPPAPSGITWEPWSAQRVAALQAEGKPVFVDFTADWCINCKYNERFVLETAPVRAALKGFVALRGDWTKGDPAISAELKTLGRVGVPVNVIYPARAGGAPEVLPELLTRSMVLEALNRAAKP